MKNLFVILAAGAFLISCNGSTQPTTSETTTTDTTVVDSTVVDSTQVDTTVVAVDTLVATK